MLLWGLLVARIYIPLKAIALPFFGDMRQAGRLRILWIDRARIIACFFALTLHTSAGVVTRITDTGSSFWWMGNLVDSFCRWSMPVFVMISGALFLGSARDEPLMLFYKKRASRILLPLVFWTVFYLLFTYFGKLAVYGETISAAALFNSVLSGLPYYHLWYLYMIIGLYFFTPFLLKVVKQSTDNELLVLCAALFAFSMAGNLFITYYIGEHVPAVFTFIYYLPYFLAGYVIDRLKYQPPAWLLWSLFGVCGLINSFGYYLSFNPGRAAYSYFCNCLNPAVVLMALSMMFLLKRVKISFIHPGIINRTSAMSLGIYLIHPFFIDLLRFIGVSPEKFFPLLSVPLIALLVFALSLAASLVLGRIPGLDRTIGL
jgi:surface polysaccharide O-acyltransferase-like enzyme